MQLREDLLTVVYFKGAALDDMECHWRHADRSVIDFTEAHEFTLWLADVTDPDTLVLTKTDQGHFTGAATAPNLTVHWVPADLDLDPGRFNGLIEAIRTSDSKPRYLPFNLWLRRKPGPQT